MSVASAVEGGLRSGSIRFEVGEQAVMQGFRVDVVCVGNAAYRLQLEECQVTSQFQIALLENGELNQGEDLPVVRELFTYDRERAFTSLEHLMKQADPRAFCENLATIFGVNDSDRIPLDKQPSAAGEVTS